MIINNLRVTVHGDRLAYSSYPVSFPRSVALEAIHASEIELVFKGIIEYQLLLKSGAVLLFPREKELALGEFVRAHRIRVVDGIDPWTLICDPFLDTEFTPEDDRRTTLRLNELGFESAEIKSIRDRVRPALERYVFATWEWQLLGLLEVLTTGGEQSDAFFDWVFSVCRRGYAHAKPLDPFAPVSAEACERRVSDEMERLVDRKELRSLGRPAAKRRWWQFRFSPGINKAEIDAAVNAHMFRHRKLQETGKWLAHQYTEPHRRYHRIEHLLQVMSLLNSQPDVTTPALLAGLFHDAIYSPRRGSNEKRSAAALREQLEPLALPAPILDKASELILYTQRHEPTEDPESQLVHDADLGIFGLGRDQYSAYAAGVREEYGFVPDLLFRPARVKILRAFIERAEQGRFFYRLDPIFEPQVASNLRWELEQLEQAGS